MMNTFFFTSSLCNTQFKQSLTLPESSAEKLASFFGSLCTGCFYPPSPVSQQQCFAQMLFQETGMGSSSGFWGKEQCGEEESEFHWSTGLTPEIPRGIDPTWQIPGGESYSPLPWCNTAAL